MIVLKGSLASFVVSMLMAVASGCEGAEPSAKKVVLVIHGGSGARPKAKMTAERKAQYEEALKQALRAGHEALHKNGGTSLDAVEAAIKVMEDSPLFNAGKGAVFTHDGRIELDASIMDGRDKRAGAVAAVSRVKNPISAARAVMEKSPHVLLVGDGADRFALGAGVPEANPVDFWTEERWKELQERLKRESHPQSARPADTNPHFGTVGAVALDRRGNLAAGTSTGGMTGKRHGRVGDSPLIGAGTYAENGACGVSCTGHGELFIRHVVAHEVVVRVRTNPGRPLAEIVKEVLASLPQEPGGVGGLIALDAQGRAAMEYNTEGMYRGTITEAGEIEVAIY